MTRLFFLPWGFGLNMSKYIQLTNTVRQRMGTVGAVDQIGKTPWEAGWGEEICAFSNPSLHIKDIFQDNPSQFIGTRLLKWKVTCSHLKKKIDKMREGGVRPLPCPKAAEKRASLEEEVNMQCMHAWDSWYMVLTDPGAGQLEYGL